MQNFWSQVTMVRIKKIYSIFQNPQSAPVAAESRPFRPASPSAVHHTTNAAVRWTDRWEKSRRYCVIFFEIFWSEGMLTKSNCRLIDWLIDWLIDCVLVSLIDRSIDWFTNSKCIFCLWYSASPSKLIRRRGKRRLSAGSSLHQLQRIKGFLRAKHETRCRLGAAKSSWRELELPGLMALRPESANGKATPAEHGSWLARIWWRNTR